MGRSYSSDDSSSSSSSSDDSPTPAPSPKSNRSKSLQSPKPTKPKGKSAATSSPVGAGPRTPKASKGYVQKAMEVVAPTTPRNMDGTLWKNPLNRWTNKPDDSKITEAGTRILVKVPPRSNSWRKSHPHPHVIQDNAPFYWHKVSGDFEVMVKLSGDFGHAEDRAGIMARLDDQTWVHTGLEMGKDGSLNHFTLVTRDFTDRSTSPLPQDRIERANGVWICMKRMGNAFETFYSFDAMKWDQSRQGLFTDRPVLQVGLCGACPAGKEYSVVFDQYRVKTI